MPVLVKPWSEAFPQLGFGYLNVMNRIKRSRKAVEVQRESNYGDLKISKCRGVTEDSKIMSNV